MHRLEAEESLRQSEIAMLPVAPGEVRQAVLERWQGIVDAAESEQMGVQVRTLWDVRGAR